MPTLILSFPGRRYHATPWGHHVNEGLIEWPPSPWRLLRALLGVGYAKGFWGGEGPPEKARSLFDKLAADLPVYGLPMAVGAHSRHYMPLTNFKGGREETTLVFDAWAQIDDGELTVTWEADLDADEHSFLASLTSKLGYLGRAESWVEARLIEPGETFAEANCFPETSTTVTGWEQVSLLAPLPGEKAYREWKKESMTPWVDKDPVEEVKSKGGRDKSKSKLMEISKSYPSDLIDALQKETSWLRRFGWSRPPGSRRVLYRRKRDALRVSFPTASRAPLSKPVRAMLLSMSTRTGNRQALPQSIHTLIQGERLHKALMAVNGRYNLVLSGCDEAGTPLRSRHQHAHVLPLDLDGDGHLDHFVVWAPMGLDDDAQRAVRSVRRTYAKNMETLHLALAASCDEMSDFLSTVGPLGDGLRSRLGIGGAAVWVSDTPFVPPRHLKPRGKNSLEGQIVAELASRGFPEPAVVAVIDPLDNPSSLRHRHFSRLRRDGPPPPLDCGFTVRLVFDCTVLGPMCLGYGSHFGLGRFMPCEEV